MLRKWNSPSATVGFTKELPETNEADNIPCWKDNNGSDLKFSCEEELTVFIKNEVSRLVGEKFSDVFADEPGKTDVMSMIFMLRTQCLSDSWPIESLMLTRRKY